MKNLTAKICLIVFLLFPNLKIKSQSLPEWTNKLQFYQLSHGYSFSYSPIIHKCPFTAQGWGLYFPNSFKDHEILSEINQWKSRGKIYLSFGPAYQLHWSGETNLPDSHRLQDINGNYINNPISGSKQYTLCSEDWLEFVKQANRRAIDLGADGIQVDEVNVFPYLMLKWGNPQLTFDPVTMQKFKDYLKNKYSASYLLQNYGISNIDNFHFGSWIKANGKTENWADEPLSGLSADFFNFLIQTNKSFVKSLKEDAKTYAKQKYNRDITFSGNPNFNIEGYFLVDELDFFLAEHFALSENDPIAPTIIKSLKGIKKWPVNVIPEPKKNGMPQLTRNLIRLLISEIYASGGMMVFGEKISEGTPILEPIDLDYDVLNRYMNFIFNNEKLYLDLKNVSDVAVLNSYSSRIARYFSTEGNMQTDYSNNYTGICKLLCDANIQFDCIFAPDNRFTSAPDFSLSDLEKYQAIILPNTFILSDQQVQVILNFLNNGGIVIAFGNIGTHKPDGSLANRTELFSLQGSDGVKNYGKGKFVYCEEKIGQNYLSNTGTDRLNTMNKFKNMLLPYILPNTIIENYNIVNDGGSIAGFLYKDKFENYITHIVNYDFNKVTDSFSSKENITYKIYTKENHSPHAIFVSPDFRDIIKLPTTFSNGYTTIQIPKLEAYGILVLQKNSTAPVIRNRTPNSNQKIVGGDSLLLSVEAEDPDGNNLFYKWYVNESCVDSATGPAFVFRTNFSTSGKHKIRVVITDAISEINSDWEIDVVNYKYPKIFFDESKNERNTISYERAVKLNPEHPDWVFLNQLKSILEHNYIVERSETTNFSSLINNYDALILAAPDESFTSSEINNILSFVENGGSLFVICDAGLNSEINNLLQNFGIRLVNNLICCPAESGSDPGNPVVLNFSNHPSVGKYPMLEMNWGAYLITSSPAIPIAFTESNTWCDINNDLAYNPNEMKGPFTVMAASEFGKGRVIVISDNPFHDGFLLNPLCPNDELFYNSLKWLTEKVNRITSIHETDNPFPTMFKLYQNFPNPLNPSTTINYTIPNVGKSLQQITLKVYDILGREIAKLVDEYKAPGSYSVNFTPTQNLASGVYFYRLTAGSFSDTKKMIFLK